MGFFGTQFAFKHLLQHTGHFFSGNGLVEILIEQMKLVTDLGLDVGELSLKPSNHRLNAILQPIDGLVEPFVATTRCLLLFFLFGLLAGILANVPGH